MSASIPPNSPKLPDISLEELPKVKNSSDISLEELPNIEHSATESKTEEKPQTPLGSWIVLGDPIQDTENLDALRGIFTHEKERAQTLLTSSPQSRGSAMVSLTKNRIKQQVCEQTKRRLVEALSTTKGSKKVSNASALEGIESAGPYLLEQRSTYEASFKALKSANSDLFNFYASNPGKTKKEVIDEQMPNLKAKLEAFKNERDALLQAIRESGGMNGKDSLFTLKKIIDDTIKTGTDRLSIRDELLNEKLGQLEQKKTSKEGIQKLEIERKKAFAEAEGQIQTEIEPIVEEFLKVLDTYFEGKATETLEEAIRENEGELAEIKEQITSKTSVSELHGETHANAAALIEAADALAKSVRPGEISEVKVSLEYLNENSWKLDQLLESLATKMNQGGLFKKQTQTAAKNLLAKLNNGMIQSKTRLQELKSNLEQAEGDEKGEKEVGERLEKFYKGSFNIFVTKSERALLEKLLAATPLAPSGIKV